MNWISYSLGQLKGISTKIFSNYKFQLGLNLIAQNLSKSNASKWPIFGSPLRFGLAAHRTINFWGGILTFLITRKHCQNFTGTGCGNLLDLEIKDERTKCMGERIVELYSILNKAIIEV